MNIAQKIELLYDPDTSLAYRNLQELEAFSEQENALYPYFDRFFSMLKSEKYVIRVRGFRLLCKQARWDIENKIDQCIDEILLALDDEKPTAVRQALKALKDVIPYKKALHENIAAGACAINYLSYKDTVQGLILKDIQHLLKTIEAEKN